MKKITTIIMIFGLFLVQAQQVGINTDTPKATLDMKKDQSLAETTPQGVLFPRFTTAERTKFTDVEKGMMIYNTDPDKECVEIYTGIKSGVAQWDCMPGAASASAQNIAVTPVGFDGYYVSGVSMTATNKVKFELKNNSFSGISNVDFSGAVSLVYAGLGLSVNSTENSSVSLAAGASTVLSYSLTGTPAQEGTLTAKFDKLSLQADQSTQVGWGTATIADKTAYVVSLTTGGTTIQGKINNGAEQLTIKIPYTQGQGSYNAFTSNPTVAAAGEDGNARSLTLNIPAGNFGVTGNLTATITVDSEYLVKQQAPGVNYDIVTFPITMGGSTFNVVVKGIGGIPDRNFGNGTHDFIYLPVEVTGTHNVNGQPYNKTWLNLNLGAEYAKVSSSNFNPAINKTGSAAHSDPKTHGSLFQWQRKSDGHEFRNSQTTSTPANSWSHTSTSFITTNSSTNWNWVSGGQNDTSGANVQLWQTNGANNPCPVGYHVPTKTEWQDLHEAITGSRTDWSLSFFWNQSNIPNFATAGTRERGVGNINHVGSDGHYWSSESNKKNLGAPWVFRFGSTASDAEYNTTNRSHGKSARCLKD